MVIAVSLFLLFSGCRGTVRLASAKVETPLELLWTVATGGEVVDICVDGGKVLLLDGSGTRVIVLNSEFAVKETIPLEKRLVPSRGISADRYYIYLYDDKTLYRLAKDKLTMSVWLNNLWVAGLASYAPGEMLVSDRGRRIIWFKTLFGESRTFLDQGEVVQPGAMAIFPEGIFGVLEAPNRLLKVNRAGIVLGSFLVPEGVDLLTADKNGGAWVARRGEKVVWLVENGGVKGFELPGTTNLRAIAAGDDKLVVLNGTTRILVYLLPSRS